MCNCVAFPVNRTLPGIALPLLSPLSPLVTPPPPYTFSAAKHEFSVSPWEDHSTNNRPSHEYSDLSSRFRLSRRGGRVSLFSGSIFSASLSTESGGGENGTYVLLLFRSTMCALCVANIWHNPLGRSPPEGSSEMKKRSPRCPWISPLVGYDFRNRRSSPLGGNRTIYGTVSCSTSQKS